MTILKSTIKKMLVLFCAFFAFCGILACNRVPSGNSTGDSSSTSIEQSSSTADSSYTPQPEAPVLSDFEDQYEVDLSQNATLEIVFSVTPQTSQIEIDLNGQTAVTSNGGCLTFSQVGEYTFTLTATNDQLTDSFVFNVLVYNYVKLQGDGSQDNPYLVSDSAHLELLSQAVYNDIDFAGLYFKQTNDIALDSTKNWNPIGSIGVPFKGIYDGGNFKVHGLNISTDQSYQGLFGFLQSGKILNLTVEGQIVAIAQGLPYAHSFAGGIVGAINNGAQVINCTNKVDITGDSYLGGIVGEIMETDYMDSGVVLSKVENCFNYGKITVNASTAINENAMYYGGIAGRNNGVIKNCENYGEIDGNDENSTKEVRFVGGITGYSYHPFKSGTVASETMDYISVENCKNFGLVCGDYSVGGIVGTQVRTVLNCENNGEVKGENCVGGIVGILGTTGTIGEVDNVIKNCVNNAQITSTARNLGGIVGYSYGDVISCNNTGNIGYDQGTIYYVGGIVGTKSSGNVDGCSNSGKITAFNTSNSVVGGIVGDNKNGNVLNCENSGVIEGALCAGGIVGRISVDAIDVIIDNCVNTTTASVTANSEIGGIVGRMEAGSSSISHVIKNCENYASIVSAGGATKYGYTGGIVGMHGSYNAVINSKNYGAIVSDKTNGEATTNGGAGGISGSTFTNSTITDCENAGSVSGNDYIGGIVGIGGRLKDSNYTLLSGCKNSGDINSSTDYAGGIAGACYQNVLACVNEGKVTTQDSHAGGLVGYLERGTIGTQTQDGFNCVNNGLVSGAQRIGGIVGYVKAGNVIGCKNASDLNANKTIGGIAGYLESGNISYCENVGNIACGGQYSAGIIGYVSTTDFVNVEYCVNGSKTNNTTLITGTSSVAGIVAYANKGNANFNVTVSNCKNYATVSKNDDATNSIHIGGIVGMLGSYNAISNCYNNGKVTGHGVSSSGGVGGIAGSIYSNNSVTNSTNEGAVTANYCVGGIVGFASSNTSTKVDGCINNATVTTNANSGNTAYAGGIVGYAKNLTISNNENTVSVVNTNGAKRVGDIYGGGSGATDTNNAGPNA